MNNENPPNNLPSGAPEQQPEAPDHELRPPQPTPPVYAPPPQYSPPPQQHAPSPQQSQPWAQGQQQPPQFVQPPQFGPPQPPAQPTQFVQQQPQPMPQQPMPQQQPVQPQAQPPQPQPVPPQAQPPVPPQQPQQLQQPQQPQQPQLSPQVAQVAQVAPPQAAFQSDHAGAPPVGAPPSKGLPVGAWVGILAGVFGLLLVLVIGVAAIMTAFAPSSQESYSTPPSVEAPDEEPEAPVAPDEPVAPADLKLYSLDETPEIRSGPYWLLPVGTNWDIVTFDVEGENELKNDVDGCMFYTYQGFAPAGITATDDRGATEQTLETALTIGLPWTAATMNPEVLLDGTHELPVDSSYAVEVQRFVANYTTADGERRRQMLARTFIAQGIAMYAEIDCPATSEGDAAAQQVIDELKFTEY